MNQALLRATAVALALLGGCITEDDADRCGKIGRVAKTFTGLACATWAELDAGSGPRTDAPTSDGPAPGPQDGGADAPQKGTWGDPCTRDEDCGRPDPVNGATNRCGIQPGGQPFPGQTTGICTREGCDLNDVNSCPGDHVGDPDHDWECIEPSLLGFPGFPIACWCLAEGGGGNCNP